MNASPARRILARAALRRPTTTIIEGGSFFGWPAPSFPHRSASTWRVAVVGSGPSGCYTAKYLRASGDAGAWEIDVLDRLPTAYGLVRNGVAPDHPEVKNVQHDFDAALFDEPEESGIRFYGNVTVGTDVSLEELRRMYDMVVLAYGCESDRSLAIPGGGDAPLRGVLSAREFVNWYNGHPDFEWVGPVVEEALGRGTQQNQNQSVVVVGHGNVALDCARILAKSEEELDPTDLATRALRVLNNRGTTRRSVSVVGRRGHVQGAFTIKELRELTKLPHADFEVRADELEAGRSTEASKQELEGSRPRLRMDKLLAQAASGDDDNKDKDTKPRNRVGLRFLLNPVRFESSGEDPGALARVVCERTRLVGDAGQQTVEGTGEEEALDAQLALVSIGYKGLPIEGVEEWFDESRGTLRHRHGLVAEAEKESSLGAVFCSGWLKRGPSGIIGTNIPDARDTVNAMVHHAAASSPKSNNGESLASLLTNKGVRYVDWEAHRRIDALETSDEHKRHPGQPREKLTTTDELLEAAFP